MVRPLSYVGTLALVFALVFPGNFAFAAGKGEEFIPPRPEEVISTEGGSVSVWSTEFKLFKEEEVSAALITVQPESLALPHYLDSHTIAYVLEGEARAGLITPFGIPTNVRIIRQGDVVAIPRGWAHWVWNSDSSKPLRALAVNDLSLGPEKEGRRATPFHLIGAQKEKFGGILHGFSKDILAHAWDLEEGEVEKLLQSQQGHAFVKVKGQEAPSLVDFAGSNGFALDFVYNLRDTQPDLRVREGGSIHTVNRYKLPILKKLGLSASRVRLEPGALFAPHWLANSANIIHVTCGKGRLEITYPDGRSALRKEVASGDVLVLPPLYPTTQLASDNEELEWVSITPHSHPYINFLAGANSVFKAIPEPILTAAFNVNKELEDKFYQRRRGRYEVAIFPRGKKGVESISVDGRRSRGGMD